MKKAKPLQKQKPTENYGIKYSETIQRHITDDNKCSCGGVLWNIDGYIKCGDCGYIWSKKESS